MKTTAKLHQTDNPPVPPAIENNHVPGDRPTDPNPVVEGTRWQGVEYPDQSNAEPDGESATGREEAQAARLNQETIGTPAASPKGH